MHMFDLDGRRTGTDPTPVYGLPLRLVQHHHHILCHGVGALSPDLTNFLESDRRGVVSWKNSGQSTA